MSVAFRREGDDEHMEPKFELPLPPGPNWVTARGLRLTQEMAATLEAVDDGTCYEGEVKLTKAKYEREYAYPERRIPGKIKDQPAMNGNPHVHVDRGENVIQKEESESRCFQGCEQY